MGRAAAKLPQAAVQGPAETLANAYVGSAGDAAASFARNLGPCPAFDKPRIAPSAHSSAASAAEIARALPAGRALRWKQCSGRNPSAAVVAQAGSLPQSVTVALIAVNRSMAAAAQQRLDRQLVASVEVEVHQDSSAGIQSCPASYHPWPVPQKRQDGGPPTPSPDSDAYPHAWSPWPPQYAYYEAQQEVALTPWRRQDP